MSIDDIDVEVANALTRLACAAELMAKNGQAMVATAGFIKPPALSERDTHRAHAWLQVYCAALNCDGVSTSTAISCADRALVQYESRFLQGLL